MTTADVPTPSVPLADPLAEAARVVVALESAALTVRLLGGAAIQLRAGSRLAPVARRTVKDIDLLSSSRDRKQVASELVRLGYRADESFNQIHGHRRLLMFDDANERQVDVFVESFQMCHDLPLMDRIELEPSTLPLVELLMTKLQIVKLNPKDLADIVGMLLTHDVGVTDGDTINGAYLARLTAGDWGLHHTFQLNLERVMGAGDVVVLSDAERERVQSAAAKLVESMDAEEKSRKWKMRARVGPRVRWYEEPEEVDDSP